jgi:hypothetical protein
MHRQLPVIHGRILHFFVIAVPCANCRRCSFDVRVVIGALLLCEITVATDRTLLLLLWWNTDVPTTTTMPDNNNCRRQRHGKATATTTRIKSTLRDNQRYQIFLE